MRVVVILLCLHVTLDHVIARDLRVGAFNIQVFGSKKSNKPEVMEVLVKVCVFTSKER